MNTSQIQKNIEQVFSRIQSAASKAGRGTEAIQLIAVSKLQPVEKILTGIQYGLQDFGENYPEETLGKITSLTDQEKSLRWHMIGHLQSRKARIVANNFSCIHSIDSLHVAQVLSRELQAADGTIQGLIELNLTGESSKTGFSAWNDRLFDQSLIEIEQIVLLDRIEIIGLMTMPPLSEDPQDSRPVYQKMQTMQEFFHNTFPKQTWKELSMGTSFDFEVAIAEGATKVRIGQAIFGQR